MNAENDLTKPNDRTDAHAALADAVLGRFPAYRDASEKVAAARAEGRAATFTASYGTGGFSVDVWIGKQPKKRRGHCGAKTRAGTPCKARCVVGKARCRMHGGLSSGPKTAEGRVAIAESNRRRAAQKVAQNRQETGWDSAAKNYRKG